VARIAVALAALALLIAFSQWVFTLAAGHVDPLLIPSSSRRRVRWLMTNTGHIYLAAAGTITSVALIQAAALLG
jgi:hypothetical protein